MRTPRQVLLLLLISSLTFFAGLGRPAITDADEAYYAEASREMVETGDWLTPHFNYRYRWEKPVLYYWLTAATYSLAGTSEWAARLWSAIAGVGLTILTWAIARRSFPTAVPANGALLAGAMVCTSFGYFYEGRLALPDLLLAFFITLAIWAAIRASVDSADRATRWWVMAGLSAGFGFLTKGPVAVVVPAVVLLPIWWRERVRVRAALAGAAIAGSVAALVGLPWYLAMWAEHGMPYLHSFFVGDNLQRFATGRFNERRVPGFYVAILLGGLLPWSGYLVAVSVASMMRLRRAMTSLTAAQWRLLIWASAPVLLFTVSVGQQPRYILPVLPPVAVLVGHAVARRIAGSTANPHQPALRAATWSTAALFIALAIVLARAQPLFISAFATLTWLAVGTVVATGVAMAAIAVSGAWKRLPAAMAACAVAVLLAVQFGVLVGRRPEPVEQMAALVAANRTANEPVGAYRAFVRNLVFYSHTRLTELGVEPEAIGFVQTPGRVLLVTLPEEAARIQAESGVPLRTIASVRYLNTANLKVGTLLWPNPEEDVKTIVLVTNR